MTATTHEVSTAAPAKQAATPRFYGVQMLRGVAAVFIVFFHAERSSLFLPDARVLHVLRNCAFGVDLFFPISGVVMYLTASSLLRKRKPRAWAEFAWRRIVRVFPLYWVFTTVKLILVVYFPKTTPHSGFLPWHTIASYLLLPAYNSEHVLLPLLPVGWTLTYELFFYFIVTLALLFRMPLLLWCTGVIAGVSVLSFVVPKSAGAFTFLLSPLELEFLAGMFLAWLVTGERGRRVSARLPTPLLLFVAAVALFIAFYIPAEGVNRVGWGACGSLLVGALLCLEPRLPFRRLRSLLLLGDISYSLYLSHTFLVPAIAVVTRRYVTSQPSYLLYLALTFFLCVGFGTLVHFFLEIPLLRLPSGWRLPWSVEA